MTSTDAKSVVLAYLKAIDERNPEAIQATLWEDVEFRIPGDHALAGNWVGMDEILNKFMLPLMDLFSPRRPLHHRDLADRGRGRHGRPRLRGPLRLPLRQAL
ncbi:hypothetical protein [Microbacterium terregens]|uniref:nuclear transport factor 2 family protein n=1 Tax=Microbacterium terregens TaxID=69363 RepID=UPI0031D07977